MKKILLYISLIILAIGSIAIVPRTANAKSCDYEFYSANDISFYDPCSACSAAGTGGLSGDSNEVKVFNWLISKGFNDAQAAGMMGNINTESGFNPFRMQTTYSSIEEVLPIEAHGGPNLAFGLVQWGSGRRQQVLTQIQSKFPDFVTDINTYGKSRDDYKGAGAKNDSYLSFELDFMYQELQGGYSSVMDEIKSQPNSEEGVRTAAEAWNRHYEVSGDYSTDRADKGVEYYNQLKGTAIAVSASPGSSSDTPNGGGCGTEAGQPAGQVVWYAQCDDKWAQSPYSSGGTICGDGCGPTSMAMILASLVDKSITPPDVVAAAGDQSGSIPGTNSPSNLLNGVSAKWGVTIDQNISFSQAVDFVKSGQGYVLIQGQGQLPFTNGGHLVAMVGVTADGSITIADPATLPDHKAISDYPASTIETYGNVFHGVHKKS